MYFVLHHDIIRYLIKIQASPKKYEMYHTIHL